ncbi:MAG TPA: hypothetical protein VLA24_14670 [Pseudomonadales bacterium]|nr:hypothetical protein [Pseudomonadales bacterium]
MATTTYLSNPTVLIGAVDLSDQCTAATLTVGYDSLEATAFGDTGRKYVKGLESVEVTLTLFNSYGAAEVEATLFDVVGDGTTVLTISPAGTTESATNPEYTITNAMMANFTPINATVGELGTVEVTFTGGTWVRDITSP